mgnify:CR=1 FL=1
MRKGTRIALAIALFAGSFGFGEWESPREAQAFWEKGPRIADIASEKTMLMDDGSMWSVIDGYRVVRTPGQVAAISGDDYFGIGMTWDGYLAKWGIGSGPRIVEGQRGVTQLSGPYWLKKDGTVWVGQYDNNAVVEELNDIRMIGYGDRTLAALAYSGDLLLERAYSSTRYGKIATVDSPNSVQAMAAFGGRVALLYSSGEVVVYETANFDDNGKIVPVTIAEDAIHIQYTKGDPTDVLLVVRKDGTLWKTGDYGARWELSSQVEGVGGAVKTAAFQDDEHFYVQHDDRSWIYVERGKIKPVGVPSVKSMDVSISDAKPFVGDELTLGIRESYTNGAVIKVAPNASIVAIDNPHLLALQPNGKLKALGIGEAKVTVETGDRKSEVAVAISLSHNLTFSKLEKGTVYLPAKSVVKAMGGNIALRDGSFEVTVGRSSFAFTAGKANAVVNGKDIDLKSAVQPNGKGDAWIPGELLTGALGAKVTWDAKWKTAGVAVGAGKLTVASKETALLVKKALQGSLARFIGRDYWVNGYQQWDRFMKVTVTDIEPDGSGSFVPVFRSASGKSLKGYPTTSAFVEEIFTTEDYFFPFDPKKKYRWSSSVWKLIEAGNISVGMTKDQVKMSWGYPSSRHVSSEGGKTIETWTYGDFSAVTFVGGKADFILY